MQSCSKLKSSHQCAGWHKKEPDINFWVLHLISQSIRCLCHLLINFNRCMSPCAGVATFLQPPGVNKKCFEICITYGTKKQVVILSEMSPPAFLSALLTSPHRLLPRSVHVATYCVLLGVCLVVRLGSGLGVFSPAGVKTGRISNPHFESASSLIWFQGPFPQCGSVFTENFYFGSFLTLETFLWNIVSL